ncbi:hypothetical protein KI387_044305, partial [Taxus chinensis]
MYMWTMEKLSKQEKLNDLEAYNHQIQEDNALLRSMYYSLEEECEKLKTELKSKDELLAMLQIGGDAKGKNKSIWKLGHSSPTSARSDSEIST